MLFAALSLEGDLFFVNNQLHNFIYIKTTLLYELYDVFINTHILLKIQFRNTNSIDTQMHNFTSSSRSLLRDVPIHRRVTCPQSPSFGSEARSRVVADCNLGQSYLCIFFHCGSPSPCHLRYKEAHKTRSFSRREIQGGVIPPGAHMLVAETPLGPGLPSSGACRRVSRQGAVGFVHSLCCICRAAFSTDLHVTR